MERCWVTKINKTETKQKKKPFHLPRVSPTLNHVTSWARCSQGGDAGMISSTGSPDHLHFLSEMQILSPRQICGTPALRISKSLCDWCMHITENYYSRASSSFLSMLIDLILVWLCLGRLQNSKPWEELNGQTSRWQSSTSPSGLHRHPLISFSPGVCTCICHHLDTVLFHSVFVTLQQSPLQK